MSVPVRANDWRALEDQVRAVTPTQGVSVVVPYFEAPEALALTLAGLERQTYPKNLIEVIVVDDGSNPPLEAPSSDLDVRVVHQEDRGFGLARARNTGAKSARNDILIFLDCDMIPEDGWLEAHARWHHVVDDALTLGFRGHVDTGGVTAAVVRNREGGLADLFSDRAIERPEWIEYHMSRTNDLTSGDDDIFRVVTGGNLGVRRAFYELVGGHDESFTQWGAEDTEFGFRAFTMGAVLIPERSAMCFHQGLGTSPDDSEAGSLEFQRAKIAHLIAHRGFRRALPGRSFDVPQYLVTVDSGAADAGTVLETVEQILANRVHDLEVWIDPNRADPGAEWLRRQLGPDPRVRFGSAADAVAARPASSFHIAVPAGAALREYAVGNLRTELGDDAAARAELADGSTVAITRAWVTHRALRYGATADQVAPVSEISWKDVGIRSGGSSGRGRVRPLRRLRDPDSRVGRVLRQVQRIRTPAQAWRFIKWVAGAIRQRVTGSSHRLPPAPNLRATNASTAGARAEYALGAEIAVVGPRAQAVFSESSRVQDGLSDAHADVLVVDDEQLLAEARHVPRVTLSNAATQLAIPAFDPLQANPVRWVRDHDKSVGALGSADRLGADARNVRSVDVSDVDRLRAMHHVEDTAAFHSGLMDRAGALARLAARGVVVHVTDEDASLRDALGSDLYSLMRSPLIRDANHHDREAISVAMRTLAHRDHSLRSRARQTVKAAGLAEPPWPEVSILLATNRPDYIDSALAAVAKQSYPNLELVLALHGESFSGSVEAQARELDQPVRVVRVAHELTLGDALNTAVSAASGRLLTKFDDDDLYSESHIWDLVLAHDYAAADLVAKAAEYVYLAGSDKTIHRFVGRGETYSTTLAGGTMLISRDALAEAGGWRRIPRSVDRGLIDDVERVGGSVYRTHGRGYVLVRHGKGHTWASDDAYFLDQAEDQRDGLDEAFAGI